VTRGKIQLLIKIQELSLPLTIKSISSVSIAALVALILAGCAAAPTVAVSDVWVRSSDNSVVGGMTGAFMQIHNTGEREVALVGAESTVAGKVEIHETVIIDGAMRMQQISAGLVIPAGTVAVLEPGGNHVMLMMLGQQVRAGDEIEITLKFSDGSEQTVRAVAKPSQAGDEEYHSGHEDSHNMNEDG
jgi:periplasmic copper chaperone A